MLVTRPNTERFRRTGPALLTLLKAVALAVLLLTLVVLLAAVLVFVPLFLAVRAFAESVGRGLADVIEAVVQEFLWFADAIHIWRVNPAPRKLKPSRLGPTARPALPTLRQAAESTSELLRNTARDAISQIE